MEQNSPIPDDIIRFILNSIESVPHLEAILLIYREPKKEWDAKMMAESLYISEKRAAGILADLLDSGFIAVRKYDIPLYRYQPKSLEREKIINRLSIIYADNLIEVTNLIHSKISKQAKKFVDAFKWKNERE
jgi:hypothetical protein